MPRYAGSCDSAAPRYVTFFLVSSFAAGTFCLPPSVKYRSITAGTTEIAAGRLERASASAATIYEGNPLIAQGKKLPKNLGRSTGPRISPAERPQRGSIWLDSLRQIGDVNFRPPRCGRILDVNARHLVRAEIELDSATLVSICENTSTQRKQVRFGVKYSLACASCLYSTRKWRCPTRRQQRSATTAIGHSYC